MGRNHSTSSHKGSTGRSMHNTAHKHHANSHHRVRATNMQNALHSLLLQNYNMARHNNQRRTKQANRLDVDIRRPTTARHHAILHQATQATATAAIPTLPKQHHNQRQQLILTIITIKKHVASPLLSVKHYGRLHSCNMP